MEKKRAKGKKKERKGVTTITLGQTANITN